MMKLYRFEYSCYARKVQILLDLISAPYEVVEVPYGERTELAELTGGYIQVPVLVMDGGEVLYDSRSICRRITSSGSGAELVPDALAGPIWAYSDWCDTAFEDVMFKIATPRIRRQFPRIADRALFTLIKERKFGVGCVEQWERERARLVARAAELLQPTLKTLATQAFLFGKRPTMADAALYGPFAMLRVADPALPAQVAEAIVPWMTRLENWRL
jgi:glutathione S-transferase